MQQCNSVYPELEGEIRPNQCGTGGYIGKAGDCREIVGIIVLSTAVSPAPS